MSYYSHRHAACCYISEPFKSPLPSQYPSSTTVSCSAPLLSVRACCVTKYFSTCASNPYLGHRSAILQVRRVSPSVIITIIIILFFFFFFFIDKTYYIFPTPGFYSNCPPPSLCGLPVLPFSMYQ